MRMSVLPFPTVPPSAALFFLFKLPILFEVLACFHILTRTSSHSSVPPVPTVTYNKTAAPRVAFGVVLLTMTQWRVFQYDGGR